MDDDVIIDIFDEDIIIEEQDNENEEIIIDNTPYDEIEIDNDNIIINFSTQNYNDLDNKPSIEGITLIDNKSFKDLGAINLTNIEIENLINLQV